MPVIKWYLNLSPQYGSWPTTTTKTQAGQAIALVAKPSANHARPAHGTRRVDWAFTDVGAHNSDYDYIANTTALVAKSSDEQNGEFRNTLNIAALGGRTFTVTATKAGAAAQVELSQQYQSWRRIYYSVHYMNAACKALFESVEQEIKDIFAGLFIELKLRGRKRSCSVDEPITNRDRPNGLTLPHTYSATGPSLDRHPHHLRVVIVRDVAKGNGFEVNWTMDSTTATAANRLIRISSEGPNHREVVYTNDVAIIDQQNPFDELTVSVHRAPVVIPTARIQRDGLHGFTVDLRTDPTTTAVQAAIAADRKANLTGTLTGRRCAAGFEAGLVHEARATLTLDNTEAHAVAHGSAKIWAELRGATVKVKDPQMLFANPIAVDQVHLILPHNVDVVLDASRIHRVNDHEVWLNLSAEGQYLADIARGPINISLRRHGFLAKGPIEAQADYEFELREFGKNATAVRQKVSIHIDPDGRVLEIEAPWLAPAANNPLSMRIETLNVPVNVPVAAVSFPSPQKLKIDLSLDPALQPAAQAMAAGDKLTFKGTLKGLHSIGGYCPIPLGPRSFIALTTRKLSDTESNDATARRLKLVFCHELGHALGLNFENRQYQNLRLNRLETNPLRYSDPYGGSGNHCSYKAHLVTSGADHGHESTTTGEIYVSDGTGRLCIMYHAIDLQNMGDDFCPSCKAYLRRAPVNFA